MPTKRPPSRPARWADACERAQTALQDLEDLRCEYEEWRDGLPENLEGSMLAEKLEEVVDLDIEGVIDCVRELEAADLPLGFGRD